MVSEKERQKGALAYLLLPAIYFLFNKEKNQFVLFHVWQAIILCLASLLGSLILRVVPLVGWIFLSFWNLVTFAAWLFLTVQAYQGKKFRIPWLTDFVLGKMGKQFLVDDVEDKKGSE